MEALFKLKADDIDRNLLESIRRLFRGKEIVIKVSTELDDTSFLSYYASNEKHILNNMVAEPTANFSGNEFEEYISGLQKP